VLLHVVVEVKLRVMFAGIRDGHVFHLVLAS
jgi:hypothetical protein